jgi:NH3-dependent NAD+ synthetase
MIKDCQGLTDAIISAMKKQAEEAHTTKAEVDISGGIDSAVVAALACKAFGPENVIGVYSSINSSAESKRLARLVAEKFGFNYIDLDLNLNF